MTVADYSSQTEPAATPPTSGKRASSAGRAEDLVRAALASARDESASALERAQMLMELAMGLQQRPKTPDHLMAAVALYDQALSVCPADEPLLAARITARKGTALQAIPEEGTALLEQSRTAYEHAMPELIRLGSPEEVAEAEMNLGLVLQQLAGCGRARITDAIAAYQRSLRTFDVKRYAVEFAILQNNLATAFLSIPMTDERARLREALAVQCFEDALEVVSLIDHPVEYAMLQNNLGNALQYAASSHPVENSLRAIVAYDEALKVRTRANAPLEYANTIANKANCLWNLPDEPERPEAGNSSNLRKAKAYYAEARDLFAAHGEREKARLVAEALSELEQHLLAAVDPP
jgi:tetratricopeptide (TPR) repeat protein